MGFLDKLLGASRCSSSSSPRSRPAAGMQPQPDRAALCRPPPRRRRPSEDERAIARYKYLLRTAAAGGHRASAHRGLRPS